MDNYIDIKKLQVVKTDEIMNLTEYFRKYNVKHGALLMLNPEKRIYHFEGAPAFLILEREKEDNSLSSLWKEFKNEQN